MEFNSKGNPTISMKNEISLQTRRNIFDGLEIVGVTWYGKREEIDFLKSIFDLNNLPSTDQRFSDAESDIWQHRVNNWDWEDDWIFSDERFDLLRVPKETFLKFLCEIVHPVARPDHEEALKLVRHFNDQLRKENWHLVPDSQIAGRYCYVAEPYSVLDDYHLQQAQFLEDLQIDRNWMQRKVERIQNSVDSDPELAIGTAKELVESCCKTILSERGVEPGPNDNLPQLTKKVAQELELVPRDISDEAKGSTIIKGILSSLSKISQHTAELRGLYGTGHGRDGRHRGLQPRHARLAASAAITYATFIFETHQQRSERSTPKSNGKIRTA